jgi:hypothetical protein
MAERDRLGHELAEDERQIRDQGHDRCEGYVFRDRGESGCPGDQGGESSGHRGAREGCGGCAHGRDTDLHGREKSLGLAPQRRHPPGAPRRRIEQALELTSSEGQDGNLGSGEHAVQENQDEDYGKLGGEAEAFGTKPLPKDPSDE